MNHCDTDALRKRYVEDGVVWIRAALDADSMRAAEQAYQWSLDHPGPLASRIAETPAAPAKFYQDLLNPKASEIYAPMLASSRVPDLVSELWGTPDVWFFYEQVFLKEGGESRRTPWHQDSSYLPIEGKQLAVVWISFEPVTQRDSLEFVRGSHRSVLYDGSRFDPDDDTAPLYGTMPRLPDIERTRERFDIVSWAVAPGDVLIFHPRMLHGGAPTRAGCRRRTLSLRFFGNDAVFDPRPGYLGATGDVTETRLGTISLVLAPGAPFRNAQFPKVRPRSSGDP